MKTKVLFFARAFLARYYGDIKSDKIEPIFVTMTSQERKYLEGLGWKVYGCFEEEYAQIAVSEVPGDYLKTSFASDRFLSRFSTEKRLELLGKEISFWANIFDSLNPEFVFNETVAVEIAEVMALEAKKRSIPFYSSLLGFLPNTFYWKPDPFTGRLGDLSNVVPKEEHLTLADEYIENVTKNSLVPFYVRSFVGKSRKSFFRFVKGTLFGTIRYLKECIRLSKRGFHYEDYRKFSFLYTKYYLRSLSFKYDSFNEVDGHPYVFLPLHMEPEATLSYFVNENYRQDFLVDCIMKSLRQGQYLVVKEHPQQPGLLMERRFRELRKQYPNLLYLPSNVFSSSIIKSCDCIVTLTSTVGWEGLLQHKPVLVLGKIFFDQCPGAIRVKSISDLKDTLRKADYGNVSDNDIRLFVAKMISLFHTGCPSPTVKDAGIDDYIHAVEELIDRNHHNIG